MFTRAPLSGTSDKIKQRLNGKFLFFKVKTGILF
jgi:hypothetical protein